ncbi:deoxyribonuclease IV [Paenibacillus sp. NPDC058071]|uniref:deoxyribonuclease IV n=1 Tax=Paenibacillus sp. NPDC058071 TaxID=3346326 RepID=UPI0036DAA3D5
MRIGRHLSIRGGYAAAAMQARDEGLAVYQYFPKNPRSLSIKRLDLRDAASCADFCARNDIVSVAHMPYPANLAAEDENYRQKVIQSLLNDLEIAEACGSIGVVVHFGIYKGADPLRGYQLIVASLNEITGVWNGKAKLLIEVQSGEHAYMGTTFEELAQIRKLCDYPEKLAYCLDSCHMFASGLWKGADDGEWLDKAQRLGVLESVAAVHLNDSRYPAGSRRDRHAALGNGFVGEESLKWLSTLPELRQTPFILETPPDEDGTYGRQLNLMREWGTLA